MHFNNGSFSPLKKTAILLLLCVSVTRESFCADLARGRIVRDLLMGLGVGHLGNGFVNLDFSSEKDVHANYNKPVSGRIKQKLVATKRFVGKNIDQLAGICEGLFFTGLSFYLTFSRPPVAPTEQPLEVIAVRQTDIVPLLVPIPVPVFLPIMPLRNPAEAPSAA
jgi:hypothetical protein